MLDLKDLLSSVGVLVAVALAADFGSPLLAAVAATAPTGGPLSLWLVWSAGATPEQRADSTDKFLVGGIKGMLAGVLFYVGALTVLRSGAASGFAPLLLAGFGSWLLVRP